MKTTFNANSKISDLFEEKHFLFTQTKKNWELAREEGGNVIELFEKMKMYESELKTLKKRMVPSFDTLMISTEKIVDENNGTFFKHVSFTIFQNDVIVLDQLIVFQNSPPTLNLSICQKCGNILQSDFAVESCFSCN